MLEHATSAAECRILVDMFLARSKLVRDTADLRALTAPPPPRDFGANGLESAIVEMFLGDSELGVRHKPSLDCGSAELAETPLSAADAAFAISLASIPLEPSESR